jgi:3-deoxy-manno-octulosonate cytidylyltransferase (CMP-KDO synthetase)
MSAKTIAVIPARMASSRLPGKPLAKILGLPMIEHVRRRTQLCTSIDHVIVATCDQEIFDAVKEFGGDVVMTSDQHERCTDRVAEAVQGYDAEIVVNVQGDEPLLVPDHLEALIRPLLEYSSLDCTNLIAEEMADSPNLVKVVFDNNHRALYFSREAIPSKKKSADLPIIFYRQLGIIAFRRPFLSKFLALDPTPLEAIESCDMMRAVEHGIEVRTIEVEFQKFGVDTQDDLEKANLDMVHDSFVKKYYREN